MPMPRKTNEERSSKIISWAVQIGMLVTAFGYLYAHTIAKLVNDWKTDDNFSHGFLIPLICAFMVWQKKNTLAGMKIGSSLIGIAIILIAMSMHLAGNIGAELFIMRSSMVVCLIGITFFLFGSSVATAVLVPSLYLFFMIPIPAIIWNKIAFPLQLAAANLSSEVVKLLGITVLREGNILHLSNTTLEVVDACSGLRSLTSLLALSAAFAYISSLRTVSKWCLFLSAIPIAIFVNIVRLTITAILARYIGPETAHGFLHDLSGLLVFIVAFIMLYGFYIVLSQTEQTWKGDKKKQIIGCSQ
ncbi:exosortase/archaeosortase family protein [uncultured Desulfosarcina sp.]|uniref:exosortase/archaeosortase family protein n=1 Tax=uncultured Desulfosarcina sp. TaxID=218289 RepID=UPI0029C98242|nr:exosortase/archaeosortase family protein [uncultured Desulfosarcina sp.]